MKKKKKIKLYFSSPCENFLIFRLSATLQESEDVDLEEEDVENNLCLLFFLDSCLLLDWSLLETHSEREVCKVCCPISSGCQFE